MEMKLGGTVGGYTKAIVEENTFSIIAIEGTNVPKMELGQKILFKDESFNPTKDCQEQEYCINAFSKPFTDGRNLKIINVCSIEKYKHYKKFQCLGIRLEPRDIILTETILE